MDIAANALDVEPIRNSVSGVFARLSATSATPSPAIHSGLSLCTIATDTPGVCVSFRMASSCWRNSSTDCAGFGFSSFLSAATQIGSVKRKNRPVTIHFTARPPWILPGRKILRPMGLNLVVEIVHESLKARVHRFADFVSAFQALHTVAKLAHLIGHGGEGFGERIVDLLGIGDDHALAFAEHDVPGNAYDRGIVGDVAQYDGAGSNAAVLADDDVTQDLCAAPDHNVVLESGMTFAVFLAGATQ